MTSRDSFHDWLGRFQAGDESAAALVFQHFADQLIALVRRQLDPGLRQKMDPEDIVQSALRSFFRCYREKQFDLESWHGLWGILVTITLRKCRSRAEYFQAARRDIRREVSLQPEDERGARWASMPTEPTPAEVAIVTETVEQLLKGLEERDRDILRLYLHGYSIPEISEQARCAERTVH